MSIGPGDEMECLKREFEEFIKGLICIPVNLPGMRLYKSLKVLLFYTLHLHIIFFSTSLNVALFK